MKQSSKLFEFYMALQAWIDSGFQVNPFGFVTDTGICYNLKKFMEHDASGDYYGNFLHEMTQQFIDAGLDRSIPFNQGDGDNPVDMQSYVQERGRYIHNLKRLAWIKEHSHEQT